MREFGLISMLIALVILMAIGFQKSCHLLFGGKTWPVVM